MAAEWFAPRLKELREASGMTQQALADKAGLKLGGIRDLEQGRNKPTWETVLAIAAALGVECGAFDQAPATGQSEPAKRGRPKKPAAPAEDLTRLPIDDLRKRVGDELEAAKSEPAKKPRKKKGGAK
jgi:transcriptional regulator with XRE-family HTH domain